MNLLGDLEAKWSVKFQLRVLCLWGDYSNCFLAAFFKRNIETRGNRKMTYSDSTILFLFLLFYSLVIPPVELRIVGVVQKENLIPIYGSFCCPGFTTRNTKHFDNPLQGSMILWFNNQNFMKLGFNTQIILPQGCIIVSKTVQILITKWLFSQARL